MDEQQSVLRRHGFVVAAVALPVLVVVAFALARLLPRVLVADPRYDLVYSTVKAYGNAPRDATCEITAVDGRVRVRWTRSEQPVYVPTLSVVRLNLATGDVQELPVPEPPDLAALQGTQDLFLGGLDDVRIDTSPRAPDGYEFETLHARGSGLLGELFFSGWHGPRSTVARSGRVLALPATGPDAYYGEPATFIGWAIPAADGR